jgi:predicted acylesterase/phospholipase RssA
MPRAIALRLSWPECSRPLNIERKEHTMSWDRSPLDAVNVIRKQANGQVVLVLQGGGALGAYQGGVYEALHEAKVEPDWIIGTSIGAIHVSIIAGNAVEHRLDRLREFWRRTEAQHVLERSAGLDRHRRFPVGMGDRDHRHSRLL